MKQSFGYRVSLELGGTLLVTLDVTGKQEQAKTYLLVSCGLGTGLSPQLLQRQKTI